MVALLVVATFVLFIVISSLLEKQPVKVTAGPSSKSRAAWRPCLHRGYFYSPNHLWICLEPSGTVRIGADDLLHRSIGRPDKVRLRASGSYVRRGERLAEFVVGNHIYFVVSPLGGTIESANGDLERHPELFDNAEEVAWLYQLRPSGFAGDLKSLKVAEQTTPWMSRETNRLESFVRAHARPNTFDSLSDERLSQSAHRALDLLDEKGAEEFEQQFLLKLEEDR